eukprot:scaffold4598_cov229-Pinguiococcus_pyrenoidosus.AAC.2
MRNFCRRVLNVEQSAPAMLSAEEDTPSLSGHGRGGCQRRPWHERGESARVSREEEQRMRESNILLVLAAEAHRARVNVQHTSGLIGSSKKKEITRAAAIGLIRRIFQESRSRYQLLIGLDRILLPEGCSRKVRCGRMSWRGLEPLRIWSTPQKRIRRIFADRRWVVRGRSKRDAPPSCFDSADLARSVMHSDPAAHGADDVFGAEPPRAKTSLEHEMKLQRGPKR